MVEPHAPDADPGVLLGREFTSAVVMFHEAVGQLLGLSGAERKCLDVLDRLGAVSAGRIAEHTGLTTGAVTGMIDRLTRAGYVERTPNPADRRSVLITLRPSTPLDALLPTIFSPLAEDMTELASHYSHHQLATIADWLARTTEVLHRRTEALAAPTARTPRRRRLRVHHLERLPPGVAAQMVAPPGDDQRILTPKDRHEAGRPAVSGG